MGDDWGVELMTDTKKLREKIDESGYKMRYIANKLGITYQGFLKKVNNETEFKISEVNTLCKILSISNDDMMVIFFNA